jgi:MFS family permease
LPQFFIAPAAGVINDRLSRRRVMLFADWCRAGIVLCMLLARTPNMVWFLYVLLLLETVMWALFEPGRSAVVPVITGSKELLVANALSSTTWSFNFMVGFAVGGIVAALFGRSTVFVVNALSFVVSALLIRRMRFEEPHLAQLPPAQARDLANFTPVAEGVRYVAQDRRRLATMLVKCGLGFMGANWVLLPIFGERIYPIRVAGLDARSAGMLGMSLLMGCRGIGALLGPLCGGYWAGRSEPRLRRGILIGFLLGATGYLLLGASRAAWQACAAVAVAHAGGSIIWVFSTTLLQKQTDDRFRGRVFSAEFAFSMLTMSVVNYLAGVLADEGVAVKMLAFLTGGIVLIPAAAWALALRLWRPVRE